jgi:hypothetical protein
MAGREPSTTRRRVLGAAAALPIAALLPAPVIASAAKQSSPEAETWHRRLTRYRCLAARAEQAAESGWFRAANDRHARDLAALEARFGNRKKARRSPEAKALRDAIWRRLDEAEDAYWRRCACPLLKAAVALALTPPPDLEALRNKIAVMREQQLGELGPRPRHPLEVIEEDVRRLTEKYARRKLLS